QAEDGIRALIVTGVQTCALPILKETYDCEVVCYTADVGQGEELSGLDEKAKATGASKLYVEDLREEFVKDYVWTAVKANALYERSEERRVGKECRSWWSPERSEA